MKWFFILLLAAVMICGCEPSVRYSPNPSKPVTDDRGGYAKQAPEIRVPKEASYDFDRLVEISKGYLGTAYRSGGYGKLGVDCSGLVYAVYRDFNSTHLPPNTEKLFNRLSRVGYRDLRAGDLVFFSLNGKHASHVGIYIGDNKFIHASRSSGVIVSSLSDSYYRDSYVGGRRVLG